EKLVETEAPHRQPGPLERCETVVEPLLSKQWFVRMEPLARPALEVVREGRIRFIPERFTRLYLNWVENVRDWCISRQLWWGHRIPVWYCRECGQVIAARQDPTTCPRCGSDHLEQDPDVLDTWFSSALWPFATLGWPDQTPELRYFYPTSVLVTGFDIIFFWVARMIFMGLEFMGEVPFREVCIHGLVRDALGRKMSKSLGNGVDPLEVIEEFGADALRFSLVTGVAPGYDMRFYREKVESSRNFANKVWNASRFVLLHLRDFQAEGEPAPGELRALPLTLADRWILSRYAAAVAEVTRQLEKYDLGEGARVIYDFLWSEVCDWYIEAVKPRLYGKEAPETRAAAQTVLWYVLEHTLRLLHPFMPFLTEEIWQYLPHQGRTIMKAPWPQAPAELEDREAEEEFAALQEVIRALRTLRTEANVPPAREVAVVLRGEGPGRSLVERNEALVRTLAGVGSLSYLPREAARPEKALVAVAAGIELYLPLVGLVDVGKELTRLEKELEEMEEEIARLKAKLSNHGFLQKAPAEVVEKERARYQELTEKYGKVRARREELARL
ncbi:MAG: valine--tRNA ligase, partial [Bacillota bacterium]|nr:valine--tRNA ligase [Bacillota bacterium]